jgi:hypothetical protein
MSSVSRQSKRKAESPNMKSFNTEKFADGKSYTILSGRATKKEER